jgi:hypothetical protein
MSVQIGSEKLQMSDVFRMNKSPKRDPTLEDGFGERRIRDDQVARARGTQALRAPVRLDE